MKTLRSKSLISFSNFVPSPICPFIGKWGCSNHKSGQENNTHEAKKTTIYLPSGPHSGSVVSNDPGSSPCLDLFCIEFACSPRTCMSFYGHSGFLLCNYMLHRLTGESELPLGVHMIVRVCSTPKDWQPKATGLAPAAQYPERDSGSLEDGWTNGQMDGWLNKSS